MTPKTEKTEKGGTDTTSGAAGSESKQNKGVREGFFGPGIQLFTMFHFSVQNAKYRKRYQKSLKCINLLIFSFRGQMAPKRAKKPLRL